MRPSFIGQDLRRTAAAFPALPVAILRLDTTYRLCDTLRYMAKSKRVQLTLTAVAELKWIKTWMERDIPAKLTLSQVVDSTILIVEQLAKSTTSRVFYLPVLRAALHSIWLRSTVATVGSVLTGLGVSCDVQADKDGLLTVTRLDTGKTFSETIVTAAQIEEAVRAAESEQVASPSSLRVH